MFSSIPFIGPFLGMQDPTILVDDVTISPNFLLVILAGVVLALAFQFILTAVSAAAGVTAIGNIKKSFAEAQAKPKNNGNDSSDDFDQDFSSDVSTGVKITTAFGIWSVVTTCIALFGATALALNLSVIESSLVNTVTALVIWALFFLILFYLESRIAGSLMGNLVSAATSGLKSSAATIGSIFTASPEKKIEDIIGSTLDRVRSEFDSVKDSGNLSNALDTFLKKVDKKIPDYAELKKDLEDVAKKSASQNSSGKWMAAQQVLTKLINENSSGDDSDKKGKAQRLQEVLDTVKEQYNASPGKKEGLKNVIAEFTSLEKKEIDERLGKFREYLGSSAPENFDLQNIETNFREILNDPSIVTSMISDGYKDLDREKIIDLLDENSNLKKENLEKYADTIDASVRKITKEFDKDNENRFVKRMEGRVQDYFNGTGRQELDYSLLKNDAKRIFDNPKDSLDIIKNRFSTFDSDTLRALVTNNKYIDQENIDTVLNTLEDSKKEVQEKVSKIETKANSQIAILKRKAVIQAEHARATAASAAWWLVLSTILSGVAAMVGSIVAL